MPYYQCRCACASCGASRPIRIRVYAALLAFGDSVSSFWLVHAGTQPPLSRFWKSNTVIPNIFTEHRYHPPVDRALEEYRQTPGRFARTKPTRPALHTTGASNWMFCRGPHITLKVIFAKDHNWALDGIQQSGKIANTSQYVRPPDCTVACRQERGRITATLGQKDRTRLALPVQRKE